MTDEELTKAIAKARKILADEKYVKWAEEETGDYNEAFIVQQARVIVALADRLADFGSSDGND